MIISEKTISNLIESHFPFFYQEDNPLLIEFVKKYFEWMETETANSIGEAVITSSGTGYRKNPDVILSFANGSTNTSIITSNTVNGKVTELYINIPGNNYSSAPDIQFEPSYSYPIVANTSGINSTYDSIIIDNANEYFEIGDRVYYTVPGGNASISGLSGNTHYFVSYVNSSSLSVSLTNGGPNINLTETITGPGYNHYLTGDTATGYLNLSQHNPGSVVYNTRRLSEYKDIDQTVDKFLIYFKEKYLKNIQFQTAASTKRMVKHSLDLYRSKGTSRAIDLLFKVVFDTSAEVYLPSKDIFKLSSGNFYEHTYLEVTPTPINIVFVGKQVTGMQSGATGFVEKLVRKKIKEVYVEVFTISNVKKGSHFITGEKIKTSDQVSVKDNPKIIGSLTNVSVLEGSKNFSIGDIVDIESDTGIGAKGRVTGVSDVTGHVSFDLLDGGFGYTTSANIMVSEKVLRLTNVTANTSASADNYFAPYDYIHTNQAVINYINATDKFIVGDKIYSYYSNGAVKGYGAVQGVTGNSSFGNVYVSIYSGDLTLSGAGVNAYFTTSNVISANVGPHGYEDQSPSAFIVGDTGLVNLSYANSLPFVLGETVYQLDDNGLVSSSGIVKTSTPINLIGTLILSDTKGLFDNTRKIYGKTSNSSADITNISVDVGIIITKLSKAQYNNGSNTFSYGEVIYIYNNDGTIHGTGSVVDVIGNSSVGNLYFSTISGNLSPSNTTVNVYFTSTNSKSANIVSFVPTTKGTFFGNVTSYAYSTDHSNLTYSTATINAVSTGVLAGFKIANTLANPETLEINTDEINNFSSVQLSANDYGIKVTGLANLNSIIADSLNYSPITIGTIINITGINQGADYNFAPVVRIDEPLISAYEKRDVYITIANSSGSFFTDEIITQTSTGARGIVKLANSSTLFLRLVNFENNFAGGISNSTIVGSGSGTTADVLYVYTDYNTKPMGLNAEVSSNVVTETGSISNLQIIDSGYGYVHNTRGTFTSKDGSRIGTLTMLLGTRTDNVDRQGREGKSLGVYRDQGGFASSSKKIQDSYYYQEYSYEIRSSVTLDKYEAMLKQLLHVAGTKYFAATVRTSVLNNPSSIASSSFGKYNVTSDSTKYANGQPFTVDTTQITSDVTFKE